MLVQRKRPQLDVLFPAVRAAVLRLLFSERSKPRYVREIARISELALGTVQDELRKLSALGLVNHSSNGFQRFYSANRSHPLFVPLAQIVQLSDRLPRPDRSELHRPMRPAKQRRPRQRASLPNRPPAWEIFKQRRKT